MYLMERDVVLPPLVPIPSLPQCVATTEFAWDWPHSSSTVVSEVNRAAWCFFCHLDWSRNGQQYPINSTHSVLSAPVTTVLVSGLSNQMKKLLFKFKAKLKWLAGCADVWPRTTGAVVLRETNHTKDEDTHRRRGRGGRISEEQNLVPWCNYARKPLSSEVFYFRRQYTTFIFKLLWIAFVVMCKWKHLKWDNL